MINSQKIKDKALELGFSLCGITQPIIPTKDIDNYQQWIDNGYASEMQYMYRNGEKRKFPHLLVQDCKSVIVVLFNYYPSNTKSPIVKYAHSKIDYHKVIKDKLYTLYEWIIEQDSTIKGRCFVDSAPVLERSLAVQAGLGWIGKNSCLISPKKGSFFFIGELFVNIELSYDTPYRIDYCGRCTKCIDHCPTNAITLERNIDSERCLSYQTIEKKGEMTVVGDSPYIYGCDICQDVCPHNIRFATPHNSNELESHPSFYSIDWNRLSKETYETVFADSAVNRAGYEKLTNNQNHLTSIRKQKNTLQ